MTSAQAKNWEDVKSYSLDTDDELELLNAQIECTLIWSGKEGWPMGVIVNFIYRDGTFLADRQRGAAADRVDPQGSAGQHRRHLEGLLGEGASFHHLQVQCDRPQ